MIKKGTKFRSTPKVTSNCKIQACPLHCSPFYQTITCYNRANGQHTLPDCPKGGSIVRESVFCKTSSIHYKVTFGLERVVQSEGYSMSKSNLPFKVSKNSGNIEKIEIFIHTLQGYIRTERVVQSKGYYRGSPKKLCLNIQLEGEGKWAGPLTIYKTCLGT